VQKCIHNGDHPYNCNLCGKLFTQQGALKVHQMIHSGERPFACEICFQSFRTWGCLRIHQGLHSGEQLHTCDLCGLSSGRLIWRYINAHILGYTCVRCGKSFQQQSNLKKRQQIYNEEQLYTCGVCNKSFSHKSVLKGHVLLLCKQHL
jgi:KRAB domain-containing zinc finger protein